MTVSILTKKDGLDFLLNPQNGKWIYTNNSVKYRYKLIGNLKFQPLKGTQLVLFNVGRACNLRCKYCFVGSKKDGNQKMSLETALKSLHRVSEMKDGVKKIVFHGSEPLLNFKLIKEIVNYGKKLDNEIKYSIQTNGTLLDCEIIDFLIKHDVYIGFSLDGLKNSHNYMRPFINGQGSFNSIVNNLLHVKEKQGRASFITVVTRQNVRELDKIVELGKKMGIQDISFNPVHSSDSDLVPSENELTNSLIKTTENYFSDLLSNIRTPKLDHPKRYISILLHTDKYTNSCLQCSAGPSNPLIAIDIDGTLYPCDHFWGEKDYAIGHIDTMSIDEASNSFRNFRNNKEFGNINKCKACDWQQICSGGCPGGRIITNRAQYCQTTNDMFKYFAERIPILIENGLLEKIYCK